MKFFDIVSFFLRWDKIQIFWREVGCTQEILSRRGPVTISPKTIFLAFSLRSLFEFSRFPSSFFSLVGDTLLYRFPLTVFAAPPEIDIIASILRDLYSLYPTSSQTKKEGEKDWSRYFWSYSLGISHVVYKKEKLRNLMNESL